MCGFVYFLFSFWCVYCLFLCFFFFFFQAEDGIRDWSVTGVQTCALPILGESIFSSAERFSLGLRILINLRFMPEAPLAAPPPLPKSQPSFGKRHSTIIKLLGVGRSEERRVGKECRSWWSRAP